MAKKKAARNGKERGMPTKTCPNCDATVHARKAVCEHCNFVFPQKAPKGNRKKRAVSINGAERAAARQARNSDRERLAMAFVLFSQQGDINKALDAVASYEHSRLADFIEAAGGKEKAVSALTALRDRASS